MSSARFLFVVLTASAAMTSTVRADEHKARYISVFSGIDMPAEQTLFGFNEAGVLRDIEIDYDNAPLYGAALGLFGADGKWGRSRFEVEFSHRKSDVSGLVLNDVDRVVLEGSESSVSTGMINAWYDSPQFFDRVRLSAGAGFGLAGVDNEIRYLVANAAATGGNARIALPGTEVTYAYQFMLGAEVEITPSLSFVTDVRRVDLGDYQAERYILNTPGVGAGLNGTLDSVLDAEWSSTTVTAGIRYRF